MQISQIITKLRKDNDLSQEDLAQKLFVTRQAVSKWECDQSFPESDVLLRISKEFNISVCTLMGAPEARICQSCGMPMSQFQSAISQSNAQYCGFCWQGDGYAKNMSMDEMIQHVIDAGGAPKEFWPDDDTARRFLNALLPELERWKAYSQTI